MLRFFVSCALVLAVLALPAVLEADGARAGSGTFASIQGAENISGNPASPSAVWAAQGSITDPNGVVAAGSCPSTVCGDGTMVTGLEDWAGAWDGGGPVGLFLAWLRALLPL